MSSTHPGIAVLPHRIGLHGDQPKLSEDFFSRYGVGAAGAFEAPLVRRQIDERKCLRICQRQPISDPILIHAGVPQGAILSPLLFIHYMNDLTSLYAQDNVYGRINLFADDTSMYATLSDPRALAVYLQDAGNRLSQWFCTWSLTVNIGFSNPRPDLPSTWLVSWIFAAI